MGGALLLPQHPFGLKEDPIVPNAAGTTTPSSVSDAEAYKVVPLADTIAWPLSKFS